MKTFQKVLCVMLSILMAMSCLSAVAFAADGEKFTSTLKAHSGMSNAQSAKVTLDMVDEALKEADIYEVVEVIGSIKFTLDLRSINAVCKTLDSYDGLIKAVLFLDPLGLVLGELKDLKLSTWKNGMKRTGDDITIIKEFIELAEANRNLIKKICDGSINLGIFKDYVDVKTILGPDGVSGMLKEALIGFIYEKDTAEFSNAYNGYKNNIDAFIYDELIASFTKDYLPGLDLDENSKINDLLMDIYNISFENYIKKAISGLDIDFSESDFTDFRKLDGIVNLKGSTYNLNGLTYVKDGTPVKEQINTILGNYMKNAVPGYSWNFNGGYNSLKANIEGSIKYVAEKSGIVNNAQSKTVEQIGVEIALIILKNGSFGPYAEGVENCKTLEEIASRFLINAAKENKLGVEHTGKESYLVVLGDFLAAAAYDLLPFTDNNGKTYRPGGGKDIFEVANYIMNYILFDRAGAAVLGLSTSQNEDFFTKLDKLADYFGEGKNVNFNSKGFILGTADKKGVLDCIFTLDIVGLLDLTAIPALNKAGNVSVVEFLYRTVQNFSNNWAGQTLFPDYQNKAFTNALSNQNIANMISVFLDTLESRKAGVTTLLTYVAALGIEGQKTTDYSIESASVTDVVATGKALSPKVTVKAGGKTLTQNVDYIVIHNATQPGVETATIKGIGLYNGEITRSFNVKLDKVSSLSCTSNETSVTLKWNKVTFADSYTVSQYDAKTKKYVPVKTGVTGTSYTVSKLPSGSEYKFSVQAVDTVAGASEGKTVTAYTYPSAVNTSKVKASSTVSSIKLSWSAVTGATHYKLEQSTGKNKWKTVATVTGTSATASSLSAGTAYTFRITAIKKLSDGKELAALPVTVTAKTVLGTPSVKASAAEKSVTLSWSKVNSAEKYVIEQYKGKKWQPIKTVTGTSHTVKSLSAATEYKFRVKATSSSYTASALGNVTVWTLPSAVKASSVKKSSTPSSVKLSWSKVTGATQYRIEQSTGKNKWKTVATVEGTSRTVSGLESYTDYTFRITALKKVNGKYIASAPITVKAKTTLGTPSSLKASYTDTSITLTWSKVTNAQKYEVQRYADGKWKTVKTVTGTSHKITGLKATTKYKYAVRALVVEGKKTVFGSRKELTQYTGLKKVGSVKASSITATSAKISWSKVAKAESYEVYAYIGSKWVKKGTTKKTSITVKELPSGKKTKIRVRAVAKLGGKATYGVYSKEISVLTTVGKVSGLKASVRKTNAIDLAWKKTTGATSYEVYQLVNGKWKKLGTTAKTTYAAKSLKRGTEYKFKVRAVQKIDKKTTRYGAYSSQLKAKTTIIGTVKAK